MDDEYRINALDSQVDDLRRELSSLQNTVSEVTGYGSYRSMPVLSDEIDQLERAVEETRSRLAESVGAVEQDLQDVSSRVEDVDAQVARLLDRMDLVERRARRAAGSEVADLDDWPARVRQLAATAEEGRRIEATLLSTDERRRLSRAVEDRRARLQDLRRYQDAALGACRALAGAEPVEAGPRTVQAARFRSAWSAVQQLESGLPAAIALAQDARRRLSEDDARRERGASALEAASTAATTLRVLLRSRLADILSRDELLPHWFERALGPTMPSRDTEQWLGVAVEVLAFRTTYGVTDPLEVLGERPSEEYELRLAWYRELEKAVARLAG